VFDRLVASLLVRLRSQASPQHADREEDKPLHELQSLEALDVVDTLEIVSLLDDDKLECEDERLHADVRNEIQHEKEDEPRVSHLAPESFVKRFQVVPVVVEEN